MRMVNLTKPRRAVLDIIQEGRHHPTAFDIMRQLDERGYRFAYATVYNSLRYLTEQNLIQELNLGDGATRYDGRTEQHQHMVCSVCGAISETSEAIPSEFVRRVEAETGFHVNNLTIHFTGTCAKCSNSGNDAADGASPN